MATKKTNKMTPAKKDAADELKEFMIHGLKDLYWAEKELAKNLPKMKKNATSSKLKSAIESHLEETKNHIEKVEKTFKVLGEKSKAEKCDAMDGLLKEAEGIIEETKPGAVRDAAIIAAAQKIEHYEIASYGTLISYAKILKQSEAKKLLQSILKEEKECDKNLSKLATSEINVKAK